MLWDPDERVLRVLAYVMGLLGGYGGTTNGPSICGAGFGVDRDWSAESDSVRFFFPLRRVFCATIEGEGGVVRPSHPRLDGIGVTCSSGERERPRFKES